jgi:hypothetical protein
VYTYHPCKYNRTGGNFVKIKVCFLVSRMRSVHFLINGEGAIFQASYETVQAMSRGSIMVMLQAGRWVEQIFQIYLILPAALGLGICLASNRNEYQKQRNNVSGEKTATGALGWQPYRHLWADCLDNVGSGPRILMTTFENVRFCSRTDVENRRLRLHFTNMKTSE